MEMAHLPWKLDPQLTVLMVKMCFHVSGMGLHWFLYAHCHPTTQWRTWLHLVGDLSIGTDRLLWDAVSPDFPEVALCCPTLPKIVLFFLLDLHNLFRVVFSLLGFIPAALRKITHSLTNTFLNYFRQSVDDSSSYFWASHLFHITLCLFFEFQ